MYNTDNSDRLPFFEVEQNPTDERFGSIKAHTLCAGQMGALDYFHGMADDYFEYAKGKQAFFVTNLCFSKDTISSTLEKALLYLAACIADEAGEKVLYCKTAASDIRNAWTQLGVRQLLNNYEALVQQV